MPVVYDEHNQLPSQLREQVHSILLEAFSAPTRKKASEILQAGIRSLRKQTDDEITKDIFVQVFRADAGTGRLPPESPELLQKIQLKPMRSHSGIQSVAVLTKPFPCPGECIFCPNDIRMPKSYIASEPGAQRAERNSFDPYLQTYNRLRALYNMGHEPSKVELIILGGTWSYYPESYQIWFIHECFRALNDFSESKDDREKIETAIQKSVESLHRSQNRVTNESDIAIRGLDLKQNYNQVVAKHYLLPEKLAGKSAARPEISSWEDLEQAQKNNELAFVRCVGLTIETRPDNISPTEVLRIRRLGATKTQIGFQSLNDKVLEKNKRGHDVAATRRAVALLRQAGFKIHAHWMPNLYGSTPEMDQVEYATLFSDPDFCPDELKIYPCALIPSAELMQYAKRGEWKSYSEETLTKLLSYCLTHTPEWARLTRVIRDIPSTETVDTNIKTNQRQLVQDSLKKTGEVLSDIRAREIRSHQPELPITQKILQYQTSVSTEYFIQYVDVQNRILGFCRLSLPTNPETSPYDELKHNALIRELHVYGITEKVGESNTSNSQHLGLGKKLLQTAENIAEEHGFTQIAVISAIGTREYYKKRGYKLDKLYQKKELV